MSEQIIGIQHARLMKEAGFPQEAEGFWFCGKENQHITYYGVKAAAGIGTPLDEKGYAGYTVKDMQKWLPAGYTDKRLDDPKNKANNMADVLLELKKEGKITL